MQNERSIVVIQRWEIDGTPNGYTMHIDEAHRNTFVEKVNELFESWPKTECSIPVGEPYEYEVDADVFKRLKARHGSSNHSGNVPR